MNNFTTSEYIETNKLGVSPHDPTATKLISAHLRAKGFRQRRVKRDGTFKLIWTTDPIKDYEPLKNALRLL
jgi:hypothetical protein